VNHQGAPRHRHQPCLGRGGDGAIFDRLKGKAKWDEDADEGTSNQPSKKKNKQWRKGLLMAADDCKGTPNHFEKLLEGPCPNHAFPIEHLYKDCVLMKWFSRCSGA